MALFLRFLRSVFSSFESFDEFLAQAFILGDNILQTQQLLFELGQKRSVKRKSLLPL
jgi:hypothetical protein